MLVPSMRRLQYLDITKLKSHSPILKHFGLILLYFKIYTLYLHTVFVGLHTMRLVMHWIFLEVSNTIQSLYTSNAARTCFNLLVFCNMSFINQLFSCLHIVVWLCVVYFHTLLNVYLKYLAVLYSLCMSLCSNLKIII